MKQPKTPSVLGGITIAAGTMIGAGMLSLPIISAGMWFSWMVVVMLLTFFFMYISAEQILEVNLNYKPGASFDTLVKDNLGPIWNVINGLSITFVLYILLYAYVVGLGAIASETLTLNWHITLPNSLSSLLISLLFVAIVYWSTKAVDRISTILVIAMFIALVVTLFGLLTSIDTVKLFKPTGETKFAIYAFASLPFFLTSYCFHASVPSFVKYYGIQGGLIRKAIFYGMLITFGFYFLWLLAMMGNIDRASFLSVAHLGDNEDAVTWLLKSVNATKFANTVLHIFSIFAIVTSFLGAGLGLFDYIADLFKIDNSRKGRFTTALITFTPPIILGMIFPKGFILAIGYAGLFAAIWSVIIPAMMVLAFRKKQHQEGTPPIFRAFGGKFMPFIIIIYGVIAIISHVLVEVAGIEVLNFIK